jgi:isoleucyl-tRNA synthetase
VLDHLFACLTSWLAPVLVFPDEEAWLSRFPAEDDSVHQRLCPELPAAWHDAGLDARWERIRRVRRVVTGALEVERRDKRIGSSLEAAPKVYVAAGDARLLATVDLAELAITSGIEVIASDPPAGAFTLDDTPGVGVVPALASGTRCARCWQTYAKVDDDGLCDRCADAVAVLAA